MLGKIISSQGRQAQHNSLFLLFIMVMHTHSTAWETQRSGKIFVVDWIELGRNVSTSDKKGAYEST
jgi:hypothetical protein